MSAPGPLALLGEALSAGSADYANIRRERELHARDLQERNQAIAAARDYEDKVRREIQTHEESVYNARKYDLLKADMIRGGYLNPADTSPESFALGAQKMAAHLGPEAAARVAEMADLKARVVGMIKAAEGKPTGLEKILTLDGRQPGALEDARALMEKAATTYGGVVKEDVEREERGKQVTAQLIQKHSADISALNDQQAAITGDLDRLSGGGALTRQEEAALDKAARADPMIAQMKPADLLKPSGQAAYATAKAKAEGNFRLMRSFELQKQAAAINRQISASAEALKAAQIAAQTGAAGYMTLGQTVAGGLEEGGDVMLTVPGGRPARGVVGEAAGKTAGSGDAADFLSGKKPKPDPNAPPPRAAPAPVATDQYGGLMGGAGVIGNLLGRLGSGATEFGSDVVRYAPGTLNMMAGGERRFAEGEAERAAQLAAAGRAIGSVVGGGAAAAGRALAGGGSAAGQLAAGGAAAAGRAFASGGNAVGQLAAGAAHYVPLMLQPPEGGPPAAIVDPTISSDESPANRAAEDSILVSAPYSMRAIEIRRKRGLPQLIPTTSAHFQPGMMPPTPTALSQ